MSWAGITTGDIRCCGPSSDVAKMGIAKGMYYTASCAAASSLGRCIPLTVLGEGKPYATVHKFLCDCPLLGSLSCGLWQKDNYSCMLKQIDTYNNRHDLCQ